MLSSIASRVSSTTARRTAFEVIFASRGYCTHEQLPEEHQMLYAMCRKFADEELAPNAREWDKEHKFPANAIRKLVSQKCCCQVIIQEIYT